MTSRIPKNSPQTLQRNCTSYKAEIEAYRSMRQSDTMPPNFIRTIDNSEQQAGPSQTRLPPSVLATSSYDPSVVITIDDDIEEGEIVENQFSHIVDLLEESFVAVKRSKNIKETKTSPNPPSVERDTMFYEDRFGSKFGTVPKYETRGSTVDRIGNESAAENMSPDIICLDSTISDLSATDDAVLFVSETHFDPMQECTNNNKLATPNCLKSPAINNLLALAGSQSLFTPNQSAHKNGHNRATHKKRRLELWKEKKAKEFATKGGSEISMQSTSTGSALNNLIPEKIEKSTVPLKRIVLIDGSNVAMQCTDCYGAKKSGKDFSAEGEFRSV